MIAGPSFQASLTVFLSTFFPPSEMAIRLGMSPACNVYSEAIDPHFCGVFRCASSLLPCGGSKTLAHRRRSFR